MDVAAVGVSVEPDFADHLLIIWWRRWVILLAGLVVGALLLVKPEGQVPFAATATVRFSVLRSTGQLEEETRFVARSYARLATTPALLSRARAAAGLTISDIDLSERVRSRLDAVAGYVLVTADGPTDLDARTLGQAVAQALVDTLSAEQLRTRESAAQPARDELLLLDREISALPSSDVRRPALEARRSSVQNELSSRLASAATLTAAVVVPAAPDPVASSSRTRNAVLGFILAAILAAEVAVWSRRLRGGLSLSEPGREVGALLRVPCLTLKPSNRADRQVELDSRLSTFFQRGLSRFAVITVLELAGRRWSRPTSVAARAVARVAAGLDRRTLLVDASLGAPSLHRVLDLPNSPGLAEVLEGREDLLRTAHAASDGSGLVVLLAGRPTAAPATALRGQGLRRLVQTAQPDTTIVSLNGRTPAGVRDLVVAQSPDAVVLAGDPLRLTRRQLSTAADSVSAIGATVVAVVLCGATKEGLRQRFRSIVDATVHREIDEPDAAELSPVTEGRALAAEVELPGQARMFSSRR